MNQEREYPHRGHMRSLGIFWWQILAHVKTCPNPRVLISQSAYFKWQILDLTLSICLNLHSYEKLWYELRPDDHRLIHQYNF